MARLSDVLTGFNQALQDNGDGTFSLRTSLSGGGTITGNLIITGDLTVNGDFNFGDASVDTLLATGNINTIDDVKIEFGTGKDYWFTYNSGSTQFELWSTDTDGGGSDGLIFSVVDGDNTIDFAGGAAFNGLTLWDTGAAVTGTDYAIGRNADGVNLMQYNAPTGSMHEFSFNDVSQVAIDESGLYTDVLATLTPSTTLTIQDQSFSAADSAVSMVTGTATNSSGTFTGAEVIPTINQSGTGQYTAFKIDVTETAVASGVQNYLFQAGTDGSGQFAINSNAAVIQSSAQGSTKISKGGATTTDATPTEIDSIRIGSDTMATLTATVSAQKTTDAATVAGYMITGLFKNVSGTITQVGTTTTLMMEEVDASWDVNFTISGTNVLVEGTGGAFNVDWHSTTVTTSVG